MTLTIGLPFYNNQDTLPDAIRSVFAQSYTNWELILIDDGSRDSSLSIAQSVTDNRVRVISDHTNQGLAKRLNQVVDLANGKYIARMDADDLMHPTRIAKQIAMLQNNQTIDLVDTGILSIDTDTRATGKRCCQDLQITSAGLIAGQTPVHASVVARTEWFQKHRYDATLPRAQDFELWNRAHTYHSLKIKRIPDPLYYAREATGGTYTRTRLTHITKRKILRQHGPASVGWRHTQQEIAKSHLKQIAYFCASQTGMVNHLVATRNQALNHQDQQRFDESIRRILNTKIPGLTATEVARKSDSPI
ncbi:MAG: glycosyltransferase family A protein [Pirellulaceae bacterium]|nr:glycosyltransferase family A protein [Pirellulaceae bacterium]